MEKELDKVKLELINLYLNIKIRTQDEVNSLTKENLLLESENIYNLPILDIIEYIKSTIDIIVSIQVDMKINDYKNSLNEDSNTPTKYEILLQKLEASLRQHIAYEHQFKIEYEKLVVKNEEIDNEKKQLELEIDKLERENNPKKPNLIKNKFIYRNNDFGLSKGKRPKLNFDYDAYFTDYTLNKTSKNSFGSYLDFLNIYF